MSLKQESAAHRLEELYRRYTDGRVSRRAFLGRAAALGFTGISASRLIGTLEAGGAPALAAEAGKPLELAEWSFFWVGVERADRRTGGNAESIVNGKQMYVEYLIPARQRYAYPIVLVHGGGGQGTDWMGTPDGRRGWSSLLVEMGFAVYIVDRPGHGRSPFHPDLHGPFPARAPQLETISARFTPQAAKQPNANQFVKLHTQWPGTGEVGSPELTQLVAAEGGSFISPLADAHLAWRKNGAQLLDKIGPAVIMTHSAGGPFGLLVAQARPRHVKGLVIIEGANANPFSDQTPWGLTTLEPTYDPPVSRLEDIRKKTVTPSEPGVAPYQIQDEPARSLPNLMDIPVAFVTAEASFASPGAPGAVAYLKQAGVKAEDLRLAESGVHGNGHMMMVEKNNADVLKVVTKWITKNVKPDSDDHTAAAPAAAKRVVDAGPLKLADQGFFWVGAEPVKKDYGTILAGQMYIQYLIPAQVKFPHPIVLIHGGGGQMTHYFGIGDGQAGWAHYFAMAGYKVYLMDRVGHGRSPYHPDALGPISPVFNFASVTGEFMRADPRIRVGSGDAGDPLINQFQAGQNSIPTDNALARRLVTRGGVELLEKIGPSILLTHSMGGAFGWLIASERPDLIKAVICVEGGGVSGLNVKMESLKKFPIAFVTAELSGLASQTPAAVQSLKDGGCAVTDFQLKDHGVLGNSHFMMLEANRRQSCDAIRGWIEKNVKADTKKKA
ncbi:MAG TPA: alpha/beta fold hydrolase [Terriglobia bacterium]|nr:alpha/beta fold hydrolase [Terriglobia bacterium]